jgi:hypothetical protein
VHLPLVLLQTASWVDVVLTFDAALLDQMPLPMLVNGVVQPLVVGLRNEHAVVVLPCEPLMVEALPPSESGDWRLQLEVEALRCEFIETRFEIVSRVYEHLAVGDLVLEPLFLPGADNVRLIEANTLMKDAYLRRLSKFIGQTRDDAVLTVAASSITALLRKE